MKKFLKYILVWVIFIFALNLYMFLGSLIPKNLVLKNIKETADILNIQGNRKYILGKAIDNYTDSIMINQEYSIDSNEPVYSYMSSRRNYDSEKTKKTLTDFEYSKNTTDVDEEYRFDQVGTLKKIIDGEIDVSVIYARYWHGWMPILRILLIFMNISEIRLFNLMILILLMIYFLYLISKRFGIAVALIFGYGLIIEDYLFVPFSISAVPAYLIIMISSIILLKNIEKIKNLGIYFFLIGCFTSSMDFLTVPLLTLIIPLFICVLQDRKNNNQSFWGIFKYCFVWAVGYGLTWFSKWVIYDLIYKQDMILSALEIAKYRASHNVSYEYIFINITQSLIFILFGIILLIAKMIIKKEEFSLNNWFEENKSILFISLLPIVWYFVITEHSEEHIFFTYKLISGFIIGILLFFNSLIKLRKDVEIKCQNQKK